MRGFIQLLKNLRYLTKFSLKEKVMRAPRVLSYEDMLEDIMFKLPFDEVKRPKIYTREETIKILQETNLSIARFGDGEIQVINGASIPYQKYDKKLAERLKEILKNQDENFLVGINRWYFHYIEMQNLNAMQMEFNTYAMPKIRKNLMKLIDWEKQYCSAEITTNQSQEYFNECRKIWENKKLLIVGCKVARENLKYNIFDNAKEEYLDIPNKHAFDLYDEVLDRIKNNYDKNTLIILMAGPAAKLWAFDLAKSGYRALDLGHIAKSYDYCMQGGVKTAEDTMKFFSVDE